MEENIPSPAGEPNAIPFAEWLLQQPEFEAVVSYELNKPDDVVPDFVTAQLESIALHYLKTWNWDNTTVRFDRYISRNRLSTAKAGPCLEAYKIEYEAAGLELANCLAQAGAGGDAIAGAGCVVSYGIELNKADRQFALCLETTYPDANGGP